MHRVYLPVVWRVSPRNERLADCGDATRPRASSRCGAKWCSRSECRWAGACAHAAPAPPGPQAARGRLKCFCYPTAMRRRVLGSLTAGCITYFIFFSRFVILIKYPTMGTKRISYSNENNPMRDTKLQDT